jgi:hypothetical protein
VAPQGASHPDRIARLEAVIQQAERVQLEQPLTFLDVALAPGNIFGNRSGSSVDFAGQTEGNRLMYGG